MECLPHADQAGAPSGGIKDDVGQAPLELLRDLDSHGLLPLEPIGLSQGAKVKPPRYFPALLDESRTVRYESIDQKEMGG